MNVYSHCPTLTGPLLTLRLIAMEDAEDLLDVYGDRSSLSYFNSDNCTGDFYCAALSDMQQCIRFWLESYARQDFVRWTIVEAGKAVGTVECFHRDADDPFTDCALLRIDLRRDSDTPAVNSELLTLLLPRLREMFHGSITAIKAPPFAAARIAALKEHGFTRSEHALIGHHGQVYGDYWLRTL